MATGTFVPDVSGDYVVTLEVEDHWGASSGVLSEVVTVSPPSPPDVVPPVADLGDDLVAGVVVQCTMDTYSVVTCPACQSPAQTLTASASTDDHAIARYDWTPTTATHGESLSADHGVDVTLSLPDQTGNPTAPFTAMTTVDMAVFDCSGNSATDQMNVFWTCTWLDP